VYPGIHLFGYCSAEPIPEPNPASESACELRGRGGAILAIWLLSVKSAVASGSAGRNRPRQVAVLLGLRSVSVQPEVLEDDFRSLCLRLEVNEPALVRGLVRCWV